MEEFFPELTFDELAWQTLKLHVSDNPEPSDLTQQAFRRKNIEIQVIRRALQFFLK